MSLKSMTGKQAPEGSEGPATETDDGFWDNQENTAVSTLNTNTSFGALTLTDLAYSRMRIGQSLTPEVKNREAKEGDFIVTGYEPYESVTLVPLAVSHRRDYYDRDSNSLICDSQDSIVGRGEYGPGSQENPTGSCALCPMSKWMPSGSGKNNKPLCTELYEYIFYSVEHETVVAFRFAGTSFTLAKTLNSFMFTRKAGNFAIKMTTTQQSSAKNTKATYMAPKFVLVKVDEEILATARAMSPTPLS